MKINNMWDIHCHVIPEVDDGAEDMETAIKILEKEYKSGVRHIICTPHFHVGMFEPNIETVKNNFEMLKKEAARQFDDLTLILGCEFHSNMNMVETLRERPDLRLGNSNAVLVEFSETKTFLYMRERVHALLEGGYRPILAHVERFPVISRNMKNLEILVGDGAMIQINAQSILQEKRLFSSKFCNNAIANGLVDFVASDAHDLKKRGPFLREVAVELQKRHGGAVARNLLVNNAEEVFSSVRKTLV